MVKFIKQNIDNHKGLTLVEILAVIVILGIIAAIAVPAVGSIIDNSKKDAAIANAIQVINSTKLAIASGMERSAITSAEDIKEFIEPFPDPFGKKNNAEGVIPFNNIKIDTTKGEIEVNLGDFGCGPAASPPIKESELTATNVREKCQVPN